MAQIPTHRHLLAAAGGWGLMQGLLQGLQQMSGHPLVALRLQQMVLQGVSHCWRLLLPASGCPSLLNDQAIPSAHEGPQLQGNHFPGPH